MKKYLLVIVTLVALCTQQSFAGNSTEERNFCTQTCLYLQREGYDAWTDVMGDVNINYEGQKYVIEASKYANGYYVACYSVIFIDNMNMQAARKACTQTMRKWRYVRCYPEDNKIVYEMTGYFENVYQLKAIVADYLSFLSDDRKQLMEAYNANK